MTGAPAAGTPRSPASGGDHLAPWLRWVGHCGYAAEGVVYVLIGGFALAAALEPARRPNGYKGALAQLAAAPFGDPMLGLLALGLTAFVLWQMVLGIVDPEHRRDRHTLSRRVLRLGYFLNGAMHCVLVGDATWRLLGRAAASDGGHAQAVWTGRVMALPLGRWLVAATGAGIGLFGLFQGYRALTANKTKRVDLTHTRLRVLIVVLGAFGYVARGIVFAVIGAFLIDGAWRYDTAKATGMAGALSALKNQEYGPWMLGTIAAGLVCYGLFQILKEPFRKFRES